MKEVLKEVKRYYPYTKELQFMTFYNLDKAICGLRTGYYKSGVVKSEYNYRLNKKHGEGKSYYENGNLEFEGYYKHDKFNGEFRYYYENGTLHLSLRYQRDLQEGEQIAYDEKGHIKYRVLYKNGNLIKVIKGL